MLNGKRFKFTEGLIPIIYQAWERPLYLWASLDSLARCDLSGAELLCANNYSQDPLVKKVLRSFVSRGVINQLLEFKSNSPYNTLKQINAALKTNNEFIVYLEADVAIDHSYFDWLSIYVNIMNKNPKLGLLGSLCNKNDFIDPSSVSPKFHEIIKAQSPERYFDAPTDIEICDPFNPPGRILIARTAAVREVGWGSDAQLYKKMKEAGWEAAITGKVVHRHLSLQNFFDYPEYDVENRNKFVSEF